MKKGSDKVNDFLGESVSKEVRTSMEILAELEYPIPDRKSFLEAITKLDRDEETAGVRGAFSGSDFPIMTPQSALEKYIPRPVLRFPGFTPELPDFPERPGACETFEETWGRGSAAAACACRMYVEARRDQFNEYQAVIIGYFAGRRVAAGGDCP